MPPYQSDESVFNMALAYLERINKLLYSSQQAAIEQNIDRWRLYLRAIYRELAVKLTPEEDLKILGDTTNAINIQELLDENVTHEEATFRNVDSLANNAQLKATYKGKILTLLDALDVKLRRLLQKKGMLLPSKENAMFAVLKR